MASKMKMERGYTTLHELLTNSQKIFQNAAVLYEQFSVTLRYTVRTFRYSGSVQRKPGSSRPKVRTEENIQNVQRRMEDEP
jgi:hypothetical protein